MSKEITLYKVSIPKTGRDGFDYLAGDEEPQVGSRVLVSFRNKEKVGVVYAKHALECSEFKLKSILSLIDKDLWLNQEDLQLYQWVSRYYHAPLAEVLTLALPKLIRQGFSFESLDLKAYQSPGGESALNLNQEQAQAFEAIKARLDAYHCFLLQGVTGSGKTEVYMQLIDLVLAQGKQVLVLVPEIGLTPQLQLRFQRRFKLAQGIMHSGLSEKKRAMTWDLAKRGLLRLIIGTRSAVFTPMPDLGLIIIDEEHDNSLKQAEGGVRYFARDTALMRAYMAKIPIILGSATPSLESLHNGNLGKYSLLKLNKRATQNQSLAYKLIDLRGQRLSFGLAALSLHTIKQHVQAGKQVLIFINRRGFSPVLLCHACGAMSDCQACDSHLTLHKTKNYLSCHHCGGREAIPTACKTCKSSELIPLGFGTERIYEGLSKFFPGVSIERIDREEIQKKKVLEDKLNAIYQGQVQLIVGTQLLAKGHHIPNLTLVVVVNADQSFYKQDFRALEQLGQLLIQVSGRAGREEEPGQVLIQTHLPEHPLLNLLLSQGYDAFAKELLLGRQEAFLPPYHHLALIRAEHKEESKVRNLLLELKKRLQTSPIRVLGPAPAPLLRKSYLYRMQLLLKSASRQDLHQELRNLRIGLEKDREFGRLPWSIDIDPQDLN